MPSSIVPRPAGALLALTFAFAAQAANAAVALPAYRTFADWTVACDNVGDCEARGFGDDGEPAIALRFVRKAGAAAEPMLALENVPDGARLSISIGGRSVPTPPLEASPDTDAEGTSVQTLTLRGVRALQAVTAAARKGGRLGVAGTDRTGTLTGFNAAMLFIDDAQGRVGTPGAVARPGASSTPVPGPHPLPAVRVAAVRGKPLTAEEARRYVRALSVASFDCEDGLAADQPATVEPLAEGTVLAMVPCLRGAYQSSPVLFVGPRNDARRAVPIDLPGPPGVGEGEHGLVTEPAFDPATSTLSMHAKGRGLADCGAMGEWAFDGRRFVLTAYALLDRCGWPAPGDYLTLWRSARPTGAPR